ncbi:hypothetical protein [Rhodococcus sp. SORGH_AS_0303]|uniref:hypothetical protein n=1 Tax=Rhodococcus sp. SORGH_AS_0303 TaxID=3041753 RepID=UPI002781358B|nr:hypothetical protein [Rhodococcus sp. SORGH_AS_0303]MDQ1202710.1 hypothetical protein [Rhodococcus sp. SORGH_AS_0303]
MSTPASGERAYLVEKYPALKHDNFRKLSPDAEQIDAALQTAKAESYSPDAHSIPILSSVLEAMREGAPSPIDIEGDPGFLPGIGLSAAHSSLVGNYAGDLVPGVRRAELHALHNAAQEVATGAAFGSSHVQLSAMAGDLWPVSLGWTSRTAAEQLLALRHGHDCTLCAWVPTSDGRSGSAGGVAVTCGAVLRVITACTDCLSWVQAEYPGVDMFVPIDAPWR